MDGNLPGYEVNEATWLYLSLLLIVSVFFRFGRVWSLRNLDLLLLLSISPGLLLVREHVPRGHIWLFVATGLLLLRLFCDRWFERRPLLVQNLNVPGLVFLCLSTFAFLMSIVVHQPPPSSTMEAVRTADQMLNREDLSATEGTPKAGPAVKILTAPILPLTKKVIGLRKGTRPAEAEQFESLAARILVVVAHLAVLSGLLMMGRLHFADGQLGLAMATLYLLIPGTSFDIGKVNHVLPAALIVWALVSYRRPMAAGGLMGLACGTLFFPIFLLPLWAAFYDRRGALRFCLALGIVGAALLGSFAFTSANTHSFTQQTFGSIDWQVLKFTGGVTTGFWSMYDPAYRIPVLVAFLVMLVVLTIWPRKKNLEHLIAYSAAIIVGTQFWYPQQGAEYLLWYLPLFLLVVFRPRLAQLVPPDMNTAVANSKPATMPPPPVISKSGSAAASRFLR